MLKKLLILVCVSIAFAGAALGQSDAAKPAASATTPAAKPAAFRPTKDQIKQGQEVLIKEKLYTGQATGVYGDSRDAIKSYQKAHSLAVNGKFDRATLDKMGIALTDKQAGTAGTTSAKSTASTTPKSGSTAKQSVAGSPASAGPKHPAPFQATKEQVTALQTKLKDAKLFTGDANGERSDALKDAVKKYQDANGLSATGGINAATLQKAGIALTDKQKEQVSAQAAYDAAKPAAKQD
jgi:murein L,D-transpeptidase YcbB/YkuD